MKCVCTQNELVQHFFALRSNHSAPFSIDFPSQFNEIQCNSHVLRFLIRNENNKNNNNNSQVYLHRFDCLACQKNALIWRFWLVPLITNHHAGWINLLPVCKCLQTLGKCRWMNTLIRVPHRQREIHTAIAFHTIFLLRCVYFALCRDLSTNKIDIIQVTAANHQ